jgi:hypothetical protein
MALLLAALVVSLAMLSFSSAAMSPLYSTSGTCAKKVHDICSSAMTDHHAANTDTRQITLPTRAYSQKRTPALPTIQPIPAESAALPSIDPMGPAGLQGIATDTHGEDIEKGEMHAGDTGSDSAEARGKRAVQSDLAMQGNDAETGRRQRMGATWMGRKGVKAFLKPFVKER